MIPAKIQFQCAIKPEVRKRRNVQQKEIKHKGGKGARLQVQRVFSVVVLFIVLFNLVFSATFARAQASTPNEVNAIFERMTVEERVGQLFLITFSGRDVSETSQIYDLIVNHHVGGVVLLASNDNFAPAPQTIPEAYALIQALQKQEWENSRVQVTDPVTGAKYYTSYIPLWIGMSQEGDGYPNDQILNGVTPLPSEMAIGATWDTNLSQQVGTVMGSELSALGVNLYFGLSLDVLETVNPQASSDLGTRVFGGDPYWVGEMGRAYVNGLHAGSSQRMLVVAKHFPGRGGTSRATEVEIATVRKSLEQLKQVELAPFMAVTGNAPTPESTVDGLLVSHIRYRGFQGNIRATTRPVSFDAQALTDILSLPQFSAWRANGGLIVSDDLGSRAVREFYATGEQNFSAQVVARDALLAGNDLLYMGQIVSSDQPDNYSTILQVMNFFAQKYREDPAFASRVDDAVLRILTRKYNLYGDLLYSSVNISDARLPTIGASSDLVFEVARQATTLISPDMQDLAVSLPAPPRPNERIIFLTDSVPIKQCAACPEQATLAVDALQQVVLRLYGPQGGNQTSAARLSSYSFDTALSMLDGADAPQLATDLERADWIILSLTDASRGQPQFISRFLSERQDLFLNKRVVLFSFGAPYYFDPTDISRFTAYYALYSKQPAFVDVAARALFQELTPQGASPVSIPGAGYDLITVTSPDPQQVILLSLDTSPPVSADLATATVTDALSTPQPTPIPLVRIGDTITIRTGIILDHNGNPVPDGTIARFSMTLTGEGAGIIQQVESPTSQGIAHASFGLDRSGLLEIRVSSEPANSSEVLQLDVSAGGVIIVTVIPPTSSEIITPSPTPTKIVEEETYVTPEGFPRLNAWLITMLILGGASALAFWVGSRLYNAHLALRWGLGLAAGSLAFYNYLAFRLPGAANWTRTYGLGGVLFFSLIGGLLGLFAVWMWERRKRD